MDTSIVRPSLYYREFTWSLTGWNPYKAYFFKKDTSTLRTVIPVPLVSVIKRFDCTCILQENQLMSILLHKNVFESHIIKRVICTVSNTMWEIVKYMYLRCIALESLTLSWRRTRECS